MTEAKIELPENWASTSIGEICIALQYGYTASSSEEPCGPRFLRITDIQDGQVQWSSVPYCTIADNQVPKYELHAGDIVFARTGGTVGKSFIISSVPEQSVFASYLIRLSAHSEIEPKFLYYFFQSASYWEQIALKKGGLQGNVNATTLSSLELYLCPPNEQLRIVAKIEELFSELDKGIESLKTAREQLKVYRQAVLKNAFEGKLTEQWREENKGKLETADQLLVRIKQERKARYEQQLQEWEAVGKAKKKPPKPRAANDPSPISSEKQNQLPDLPDGWLWIRLAQLFSISPQNGLYKPASEYGTGAQIVRIDDFYDGKLIRKSGFKKLRLDDEELIKFKVNNLDLLINRVNSIEFLGKCALVEGLTEDTVFESNIMKCQLVENLISKSYVVNYLASHPGRNRLCENAKHAVNQASINQTDVGNALVPLTSFKEQIIIVEQVERKLSLADVLISEIDTQLQQVEVMRQSILKKAFSGQLVTQDPNDEPASVLLERINAEKAEQESQKNKKTKTKKRKNAA